MLNKNANYISVSSSTIIGSDGRIEIQLTDENNEVVAYKITKGQALWLKTALKHAIKLRQDK